MTLIDVIIIDGLLLQMYPISFAPTALCPRYESTISPKMCRCLWGCLSDVQKATPKYTYWLLTYGSAFCVSCRCELLIMSDSSFSFANHPGLTLVYCTWILPHKVCGIKALSDMNACSIVLYIITERWPGAKKYRDTYESIKQSLLESVEESQYEPRHVIKNFNPNFLPPMARNEEGSTEVTQILADMAGNTLFNGSTSSPVLSYSNIKQAIPAPQDSTQDFSFSMGFQPQTGYDASFAFDGLDIINGFDIGDFDISGNIF